MWACAAVALLALLPTGCGGQPPDAHTGSTPGVRTVQASGPPGILAPPQVAVVTAVGTGMAEPTGYQWSAGGRVTIADPATDGATQVLAGVAGIPCRPGAVVKLDVTPAPDTAGLSVAAGPAPGGQTSTLDKTLAFTAPDVAGAYDYRLDATWSGGREATYFFGLKVG